MDSLKREEIIAILQMQPELLKEDAFELITVGDVIGLEAPDYVHKALPLRDAYFLAINPDWIDFFDGLQSTYCDLISKMHKDQIMSSHKHPEFLNNWFREDDDMESAYTVLRGIIGWASESHEEITEALVDLTLGIPPGHTMHGRRKVSNSNVINLKDYQLRMVRNASLH
jgi:hypothetical protein